MANDANNNENQKLVDALTKDLQQRSSSLEPYLQKAIRTVIDKLSTQSGKILKDKYNKKVAIFIEKEIQDSVTKSGLYNVLNDYLPILTTIETRVVEEQKQINSIKVEPSESLRNWALDQFETNLTNRGVNINIVAPIKEAISRAVVTGGTVRQLETQLKAVNAELIGNSFNQTLYDSMREYQGAINQKIALDFGMNTWLYTGSILKTTRPQCRRWIEDLKGVIPFSELQSEIDWAYENGTGMIEDTTPQNFGSNCGGYGCRHTATPTIR